MTLDCGLCTLGFGLCTLNAFVVTDSASSDQYTIFVIPKDIGMLSGEEISHPLVYLVFLNGWCSQLLGNIDLCTYLPCDSSIYLITVAASAFYDSELHGNLTWNLVFLMTCKRSVFT